MAYDKSVQNNTILKAQLIVDQYKGKLHFPNGWNRTNNYALSAEDVTFFRAISNSNSVSSMPNDGGLLFGSDT